MTRLDRPRLAVVLLTTAVLALPAAPADGVCQVSFRVRLEIEVEPGSCRSPSQYAAAFWERNWRSYVERRIEADPKAFPYAGPDGTLQFRTAEQVKQRFARRSRAVIVDANVRRAWRKPTWREGRWRRYRPPSVGAGPRAFLLSEISSCDELEQWRHPLRVVGLSSPGCCDVIPSSWLTCEGDGTEPPGQLPRSPLGHLVNLEFGEWR